MYSGNIRSNLELSSNLFVQSQLRHCNGMCVQVRIFSLNFLSMSVSPHSRPKCLTNHDSFCYICGNFTTPSQRSNISEFLKKTYIAYFKVQLNHEDKSWAPHKVCKTCIENLRMWTKEKLAFGSPLGLERGNRPFY